MTPPAQPDRRKRTKRRGGYPPWMDKPTLCWHISLSESGVDSWVEQGILPRPVKRGGKNMWQWDEVDEWLRVGGDPGSMPGNQAERIRDATKRAQAESRTGY